MGLVGVVVVVDVVMAVEDGGADTARFLQHELDVSEFLQQTGWRGWSETQSVGN